MKKNICAVLVMVLAAFFLSSNVVASSNTNDVEEIINIFGIDRTEAEKLGGERRQIVLNAVYDVVNNGNTLLEGSLLCNGNNRFAFRIYYEDYEGNSFTRHYIGLYSSNPQLVEYKNAVLREKDALFSIEGDSYILELTEYVINHNGVQTGTIHETLTIPLSGKGVHHSEETKIVEGLDELSYCD